MSRKKKRGRRVLLHILRANRQVGTLNRDTLELRSFDDELRRAFREATTPPGMYSLGDIDAPAGPPGVIVDHAKFTLLKPGDLKSIYEFQRYLLARGMKLFGLAN